MSIKYWLVYEKLNGIINTKKSLIYLKKSLLKGFKISRSLWQCRFKCCKVVYHTFALLNIYMYKQYTYGRWIKRPGACQHVYIAIAM